MDSKYVSFQHRRDSPFTGSYIQKIMLRYNLYAVRYSDIKVHFKVDWMASDTIIVACDEKTEMKCQSGFGF